MDGTVEKELLNEDKTSLRALIRLLECFKTSVKTNDVIETTHVKFVGMQWL